MFPHRRADVRTRELGPELSPGARGRLAHARRGPLRRAAAFHDRVGGMVDAPARPRVGGAATVRPTLPEGVRDRRRTEPPVGGTRADSLGPAGVEDGARGRSAQHDRHRPVGDDEVLGSNSRRPLRHRAPESRREVSGRVRVREDLERIQRARVRAVGRAPVRREPRTAPRRVARVPRRARHAGERAQPTHRARVSDRVDGRARRDQGDGVDRAQRLRGRPGIDHARPLLAHAGRSVRADAGLRGRQVDRAEAICGVQGVARGARGLILGARGMEARVERLPRPTGPAASDTKVAIGSARRARVVEHETVLAHCTTGAWSERRSSRESRCAPRTRCPLARRDACR